MTSDRKKVIGVQVIGQRSENARQVYGPLEVRKRTSLAGAPGAPAKADLGSRGLNLGELEVDDGRTGVVL
jgi:hypothetical protein